MIPVARKVWLPILAAMPAAPARRRRHASLTSTGRFCPAIWRIWPTSPTPASSALRRNLRFRRAPMVAAAGGLKPFLLIYINARFSG